MPVSRVEAAYLMMSEYSRVGDPSLPQEASETVIGRYFKEVGFQPPEDFVITAFDRLILEIYAAAYFSNKKIFATDVVNEIRAAFSHLGYQGIEVNETDLENYFKLLRGKRPGEPVGYDHGIVFSSRFPQVRDQYNILITNAYLRRTNRSHLIAATKVLYQFQVATLLGSGNTAEELRENFENIYRFFASNVSFILDLVELGYSEQLKQVILEAIDRYLKVSTLTDNIKNYIEDINDGRFLISQKRGYLAKLRNEAVAQLWLSLYQENPEQFAAYNFQYMKSLTQKFIRGGASEANDYFEKGQLFERLALHKGSSQIASEIIHFSYDLDRVVNTPRQTLDEIFDTQKAINLEQNK
jgi:hypothetical protein